MTKTIFIGIFLLVCTTAFVGLNKSKPKLPKEYVFINGGTFSDGDEENAKRVSLWHFYMSAFEITNQQYSQFFTEVAPGLSKEEVEKIKVDSTGWNVTFSYGEPARMDYFTFPAYNYYPVVNITYEGAVSYCNWLQKKIQKDNPDFVITVKLPSRLQWTYAAKAGKSFALYPWGGNYMRDKHGKFLCNFNGVDESAIVRNKTTGEPEVVKALANHAHAFTTVSVNSYYPNDLGLYNMSGNAAEMTDSMGVCMGGSWQDYGGDVRVTSTANYSKACATVGFRPVILVAEVKEHK